MAIFFFNLHQALTLNYNLKKYPLIQPVPKNSKHIHVFDRQSFVKMTLSAVKLI